MSEPYYADEAVTLGRMTTIARPSWLLRLWRRAVGR